MPVQEFIIALFCRIDDAMRDVPKHRQALLYPSETVTLAILFAFKGVGERPFYRWLDKTAGTLFPTLPERTRLFRLFKTHQKWADRFLAEPTLLGIIDSYGIEFIHPIREGRSPRQLGKKGLSNHRWIVGGKLCLLVNQRGLVVDWDCSTANVHDTTFQPLIARVRETTVVFADEGKIRRIGRISRGGGRPGKPENLPSRRMERPDALGNGAEHADGGESFQEASASGLVVFPSDARLHDGGVQSIGAMGWVETR